MQGLLELTKCSLACASMYSNVFVYLLYFVFGLRHQIGREGVNHPFLRNGAPARRPPHTCHLHICIFVYSCIYILICIVIVFVFVSIFVFVFQNELPFLTNFAPARRPPLTCRLHICIFDICICICICNCICICICFSKIWAAAAAGGQCDSCPRMEENILYLYLYLYLYF